MRQSDSQCWFARQAGGAVERLQSGLRDAVLVMIAALLLACSDPNREPQAQQMVEQFYQALEQSDYDKALQHFGDKLRGLRSPEEWAGYFSKRAIRTAVLKGLETNTVFSGRFYIFDYQVTDGDGPGAETVTVFQSLADKSTRIVSYKVHKGLPANEAN